MASPVKLDDSTASASTPGTTKSIGRPLPAGSTSTDEKNSNSASGMISVSSTDSPRRSVSRSSRPACALSIRVVGAAPGAGVRSNVLMSPAPNRSRAQLGAGQVDEHVLERALLHLHVRGQDAVTRAPGGHRGQQVRVDLAPDQVRAAGLLDHRGAVRQGPQQLVHIQTGGGAEA